MTPNFTHLLDSLGWALVHSVWQAGLALGFVVIWRAVLRGGSPSLRYAGQMAALTACLLAFFATFALYLGLPDGGAPMGTFAAGELNILSGQISGFDALGGAAAAWPDMSRFTPALACLWALGFLAMSLRYGVAFGMTQHLRRDGLNAPSADWEARFAGLLRQSHLTRDVRLFVSAHVDGPLTLGFFKPIVLVPAGFLTGLPSDQVEAILLHEIAHIRRHDYLFNLLQMTVKTVLFFHPAIHLMSRWTDQDREQACDDLAVARGDNSQALIRGLAALRLQSQPFAMSATGQGTETPLLDRLSRLSGQTPSPRQSAGRPEHIAMSCLAALLIGTVYWGASARAEAHPHPITPPKPPSVSAPALAAAPAPPALPDTIIAPPPPPTAPIMPPFNLDIVMDETAFQTAIDVEKVLWLDFTKSLQNYEQALEIYVETLAMDEDAIEDLVEHFEDFSEDIEDQFIDRREYIEESFEDYIEIRAERISEQAERKAEAMAEKIEAQIEAQLRDKSRDVERTVRNAERRARDAQKKAQKQARKQAEKAAHKSAARAHARIDNEARDRHEDFRDVVMRELLADGLIQSADETVFLSHPNNVMSLNGQPVAKGLRGKYCSLLDSYGFIDNRTEITISPDTMKILTDYKDGRHTTRITYGTHRH